jgi:hypothetical protein
MVKKEGDCCMRKVTSVLGAVWLLAVTLPAVSQEPQAANPEGAAKTVELTPEAACGPEYHVFSPEPGISHPAESITFEEMLAGLPGRVIVEGEVTSKRTYSPGGGVYNDIGLRVTKVLIGPPALVGRTILIHVPGGYAGYDQTCWRDTIEDGSWVQVGFAYLVRLGKEAETVFFRAAPQASWFRIAANGDVIPLTPALGRNRASLAGKKISDFEERAKALAEGKGDNR